MDQRNNMHTKTSQRFSVKVKINQFCNSLFPFFCTSQTTFKKINGQYKCKVDAKQFKENQYAIAEPS